MRLGRIVLAVLVAAVMAACGAPSVASPTPGTSTPPASLTATLLPVPVVSPTAAPTASATAQVAPSPSPTAIPPSPTPSPTPTPTPVVTPTPGATQSPAGVATLDAPDSVPAGAQFNIGWTGPNGVDDYVTMLPPGAPKWDGEQYFYTRNSNPGQLVAPTTDGAYELCYVLGDDTIIFRRPITVEPFEGSVTGPGEVEAGSVFEVGWTGPNGPRDYVTIVAAGATAWTDESYFYTGNANPGTLVAPIEDGAYELWYVTGTDERTMARRPITVTPYEVTLEAPATVRPNRAFKVRWTGPDGPTDYITIVPAGAPATAYGSYEYTSAGSPAHLTAPADPGSYEIRYASDRVDIVFGSIPITVQ